MLRKQKVREGGSEDEGRREGRCRQCFRDGLTPVTPWTDAFGLNMLVGTDLALCQPPKYNWASIGHQLGLLAWL